MDSDARAASARFPNTRWTLVQTATGRSSEDAQRALAELCEQYWFPLYGYVRRGGRSAEDAEDLTQEFFRRLLEKNVLAHADMSKGRLRSFLLVALKRFLADDWDRVSAKKRGGGRTILSLDQARAEARYAIEPVDQLSPDVLFEKQWAQTLLDAVLDQLAQEQEAAGKGNVFDRVKKFLVWDAKEETHADAAKDLGLTESAVRTMVFRLRKRYGELVRAMIAETVSDEEAIASEMEHLFSVLRS